jgi:hypothetical protein
MQGEEGERPGELTPMDPGPSVDRAAPAPGRKKDHLVELEHRQLRVLIDELRGRGPELRRWSLLAKAAGLRSGFAIKRAYDVNSSFTTLRNLQVFAKLHEQHGDAAIRALKDGVPRARLEPYLDRRAGVSTGEAAQRAADAPPGVDFDLMFEFGRAIDAEVDRLWHAAQLFDSIATEPGLPRIVRNNAALARERLRSVIDLFAAEGDPSAL